MSVIKIWNVIGNLWKVIINWVLGRGIPEISKFNTEVSIGIRNWEIKMDLEVCTILWRSKVEILKLDVDVTVGYCG